MTGFKDPVFERDGQWFFADENWEKEHGPFPSQEEARKALWEYAMAEITRLSEKHGDNP